MADAGTQPLTPDDAFGPITPDNHVTADQAFSPSQPKPLSGDFWDGMFSYGVTGHMMNGFGQGFAENWGASAKAGEEEKEQAYKSSGVFDDVNKKQGALAKTFNEAFMRPAVWELVNLSVGAKELAIGVPGAIIHGAQEAVVAGGNEAMKNPVGRAIQASGLGQALAGYLEYSLQRGDMLAPGYLGGPFPAHLADVQVARGLGVIGEGEDGYFGTAPATQEAETARAAAVRQTVQEQEEAAKAAEAPPPPAGAPPEVPEPVSPAAPDPQKIAREIAPGTFQQYDSLVTRQDTYRTWLQELGEQRAAMPEAVAAQDRINEILGKVNGVEDRLTKAAAGRLADARTSLSDILSQDSPDMAMVRRNLLTTQHALWDLAPDVRDAVAEAQKRIPPETESVTVTPNVARETIGGTETQGGIQAEGAEGPLRGLQGQAGHPGPASVPELPRGEHAGVAEGAPPNGGTEAQGQLPLVQQRAGEAGRVGPAAVPGVRGEGANASPGLREPEMGSLAVPQAPHGIAQDVAKKLIAAGRPQEEADAAAALVQAHYEARAARFGGAKGTPQELYEREGPEIKAGQTRARAAEMAQKDRTLEQGEFKTEPGAVDAEGRPLPQTMIPGSERSAQQLAAAREAQGQGRIKPKVAQKQPGGLFAEEEEKPEQGSLFQDKRGSITLKDARNTIKLFQNADASTFIHEVGHQWLEEMTKDAADAAAPADLKADARTVRDWLGVKDGEAIPTRAHEKFARGFERYMMEGVAPTRALAGVFAKFKGWLTQIYQTVSRLRSPITPEIRKVFDRLLVAPGEEPIIAPERAAPASLADIHEAEAETTPPHQADIVADNAEKETEQLAGVHAPEVQNELAGKAGGIAAAPEGVPGGGAAARPPAGENGGAAEPGAVPAGGGQAAAAGAGARTRKVVAPALTRVPKEPPRLLDFIKRRGGVADDRGDIATILSGDKKMSRRLLNPKGENLDDMTLAAWEAGYFPETQGQRPTIDEMLQKIDRDYRGDAQYSEHDSEDVTAFKTALEHNAETDRLAAELGLDLRDPDFWTKVSEHMSVEEMATREGDAAASAASEFEEAERRAKEYAESRGEAWEPDEIYEHGAPRTFEDLERERAQEIAARNPGARPKGDGQPAPAATDQGPVQAGGGPGGLGVGSAGRPGGEPESDVRQPVRADGQLIDKAGNIRLENLSTTDDARAIVRQLARDHMDFNNARFGDASYALYHEIKASGQLLVETSQKAADVYRAWSDAGFDEAGAVAYAQASQQALLAAEIRAEMTAGWGRAGHAFQKVDRIAGAENVVDFIKRTTGKTLFQLREEGTLMNQLDTPEQRAKFLADSRLTRWQKIRGGILSYFINNLISGPITHAGYSVGNTVWALTKAVPTTMTAATFDLLRGAEGDRVFYREVTSQLYGMYRGLRDGIGPAARAARTGIPYMKGAEELARLEGEELPLEAAPLGSSALRPQQIFPNGPAPLRIAGYVLETPSRMVSAIHTIFYGMGYEQEIARRAVRSAFDADLEPGTSAFDTHVANFTQNPPRDDIAGAHDEALKMVLMQRPAFDSAMGQFQRAVNNNMAAKMIMPFMQIGTNLLEQGLVEHTPLGLLSASVRKNLRSDDPVVRSTQYAKIAVGTGVSIAVAGLAWEGILTGGGPSDPRALATLKRTGWQPYSLKSGNYYVPYRKYLGPLGPLIGGVADMTEIVHGIGHETAMQLAASSLFGFSEVVADESWMSGLSNFISAARAWDEPMKIQRYLTGLATDFIPFSVGMRQMATLLDPYRRQQADLISSAKANIPWWSQSLLPQRDVWGEPILAHTALGPSERVEDPVDQEFMRLNKYFPARPEQKIRGVQLTPEQYDDYSRIAGRYSKMLLLQDVQSPGWEGLPEELRLSTLRKHLDAARESARNLIMAQNPQIMVKAAAVKAAAHGAAPPTVPTQ